MAYTTGNRAHSARSSSDLLAKTGRGRLHTVSIEGATGASWILRDGTSSSGTPIGAFKVGAGFASFQWPIQFETGLYLDHQAGTSRISVTYE